MSFLTHIGTSGWSYDDWVGPFYPAGTAKGDYLGLYAQKFSCVEVDSTYYATPAQRVVEGWAARTPVGFRFALKMPGDITHKRVLADCDEEMERFLAAIAPLGEKLTCVLLQFGYFNRAAFASHKPFFARLEEFLDRYSSRVPLVVEIRNKNWLTDAYFGLLRERRVATCLVEHAWLPPIDRLIAEHDVITGPFSYVRLIGDREAIEKITKTWEKIVVDRAADLRRVAASVRKIAERSDVFVYINNHYAGHGPESCRMLEGIANNE